LPDDALLKTLEGHTDNVNCLAISPDGQVLVSGSSDNTVRLWTLAPFSRLPIGQTNLEDLAWVQEALRDGNLPVEERNCLEFIAALMRWRRRFDIEVSEAPRRIEVGEFDIEIEG
ncbi:MAG: WD40 repeat domain-containing protein, partial [Blastocatellia bacterium]